MTKGLGRILGLRGDFRVGSIFIFRSWVGDSDGTRTTWFFSETAQIKVIGGNSGVWEAQRPFGTRETLVEWFFPGHYTLPLDYGW